MNALPRAIGVDSTTALRAVHERFVAGDVDATVLESAAVRPVVAQSWLRSHAEGVDPDRGVVGESGVCLLYTSPSPRDS